MKTLLILFGGLWTCGHLAAQGKIAEAMARDSAMQASRPREKLYLHLDKNVYFPGDTIWFAAYLQDALSGRPSTRSGIIYVELLNGSNGLVVREALRTLAGTASGQVAIDSSTEQGGIYRIRAYTNWMQNFGDTLFFHKDIPIIGGRDKWLAQIRPPVLSGQDSVQMEVALKDETGQPLRGRDVGITVEDSRGKKIIHSAFVTDDQGNARLDFAIAMEKAKERLVLKLTDPKDKKEVPRLETPLLLQAGGDMDIQFLPEGGHLVAGLKNTVGFKAIDALGKAADVSGTVKDDAGDTVTGFASLHKGMGYFRFLPEAGRRYTAEVRYGSGYLQRIALPRAEESGTVIHVASGNGEYIGLTLSVSPDLLNQPYFVLARCRGAVLWAAEITFDKATVQAEIPRNRFPSGVCSFQLYRADGQLVNERTFFVGRDDNFRVSFDIADGMAYTRDSVPLDITVRDASGRPVEGVFSLAITDEGLVSKDSSREENIRSYMLLGSDLRGQVEDPGYYLSAESDSVRAAREALMLTQGFVRYVWDTASAGGYRAEPEFRISGHVLNALNKPVKKGRVSAISMDSRSKIFRSAITDDRGHFMMDSFPSFDSAAFFVQVNNAKGKAWGYQMTLDRFRPAALLAPAAAGPSAGVNLDTSAFNTLAARNNYHDAYLKYYHGLPPVVVRTKPVIPGSQNLNGPGGYDEVITTRELQAMLDTPIISLLMKKLPGVAFDGVSLQYTSKYRKLYLVIDGIPYDNSINNPNIPGIRLQNYLASDFKGIEFIGQDSKYGLRYRQYFNLNTPQTQSIGYAFVELTTYAGKGPYIRDHVGTERYRPQPFSYGKVMYQPRYLNHENTENSLPDIRSTIGWYPTMPTDKNGNIQLYFYSGERAGKYTLWLEGTDMNGNNGVGIKEIQIKDDATPK